MVLGNPTTSDTATTTKTMPRPISLLTSEFMATRRGCNHDGLREVEADPAKSSPVSRDSQTHSYRQQKQQHAIAAVKNFPVFPSLPRIVPSSPALPSALSTLPYKTNCATLIPRTNNRSRTITSSLAATKSSLSPSPLSSSMSSRDSDLSYENDEIRDYLLATSPLTSRSIGTMTRQFDRVTMRMKKRIEAARLQQQQQQRMVSTVPSAQHVRHTDSDANMVVDYEDYSLPVSSDRDDDTVDEGRSSSSRSVDSEEFFELDM